LGDPSGSSWENPSNFRDDLPSLLGGSSGPGWGFDRPSNRTVLLGLLFGSMRHPEHQAPVMELRPCWDPLLRPLGKPLWAAPWDRPGPLQASRGSRPRGQGTSPLRSVGFRPPPKIRRRRSIPYAAWISGPLTGFLAVRLDLGLEHRFWASWAFREASPMDLRPIGSVRSGRSDVILMGKPRFPGLWRPSGAVLGRWSLAGV
jgi:hypothetical protein